MPCTFVFVYYISYANIYIIGFIFQVLVFVVNLEAVATDVKRITLLLPVSYNSSHDTDVLCFQVFTLLQLGLLQGLGGRREDMAGAVSPRKQADRFSHCLSRLHLRKCRVVSAVTTWATCLFLSLHPLLL